MPCYPALALLLGSAIAAGGKWIDRGTRVLGIVAGIAAALLFTLFIWSAITLPRVIFQAR